jgi:hypothetical protein
MLNDILLGIFGEAILGPLTRSRRFQLIARIFVGLLGAGLGIVGAVHFGLRTGQSGNPVMRASFVALLVALALFWFFNVGLLRRWRWPGVLFGACFVCLILSRILLGR